MLSTADVLDSPPPPGHPGWGGQLMKALARALPSARKRSNSKAHLESLRSPPSPREDDSSGGRVDLYPTPSYHNRPAGLGAADEGSLACSPHHPADVCSPMRAELASSVKDISVRSSRLSRVSSGLGPQHLEHLASLPTSGSGLPTPCASPRSSTGLKLLQSMFGKRPLESPGPSSPMASSRCLVGDDVQPHQPAASAHGTGSPAASSPTVSASRARYSNSHVPLPLMPTQPQSQPQPQPPPSHSASQAHHALGATAPAPAGPTHGSGFATASYQQVGAALQQTRSLPSVATQLQAHMSSAALSEACTVVSAMPMTPPSVGSTPATTRDFTTECTPNTLTAVVALFDQRASFAHALAQSQGLYQYGSPAATPVLPPPAASSSRPFARLDSCPEDAPALAQALNTLLAASHVQQQQQQATPQGHAYCCVPQRPQPGSNDADYGSSVASEPLALRASAHIAPEASSAISAPVSLAMAHPYSPASGGNASSPAPAAMPHRSPSAAVALHQRPGGAAAGSTLLHTSLSMPLSMVRDNWSLGDFQLVRKLYKGYASSVYKAVCTFSQQVVCLKVYSLNLSDFLKHQVLRELDIHSRQNHKNIVQMYAAFQEANRLVMVLEYARGGDLHRIVRKLGGRMPERQATELVIAPFVSALASLHSQGICHRDIKPENLLYSEDWSLKVADFGVAVDLHNERAVTRTGTLDYMAPEVMRCPLKRGPMDNKDDVTLMYGTAADVWSLGALSYELLVGFPPFPAGPTKPKEPRQQQQQATADDAAPATSEAAAAAAGVRPALVFPGSVSPAARDFISSCLQQHPSDRPSIHDLLAHPWISGLKRGGSVPNFPGGSFAPALPAPIAQAAMIRQPTAMH